MPGQPEQSSKMRNGESPVTTRRRFVAVEKATNFRTAILSGRLGGDTAHWCNGLQGGILLKLDRLQITLDPEF